MADQDLSINPPAIAKSSTIATSGKSWGAVGSTGAGTFTLDIPLSPGRGWDPQLALHYNSQSGNGPFGIGWNLGIGHISRRTHKGVPHYTAVDEIVSHDDQVWLPELDADGQIQSRLESRYNNLDVGPHDVVRYWPKEESNFAQREYWQPQADGQPGFWLIVGDGTLHLYGKTAASRQADPDDPSRIIRWLLCESINAHGEHIMFDYKADDLEPAPDRDCRAQRYLRAVFYGNACASQDLFAWTVEEPSAIDWLFHLLFDYGERTTSLTEMPEYADDPLHPWPVRPDPFSTFGQGFELGTRRLCRQVLMFHRVAEHTGPVPVLVRRLLLEYSKVTPHSPFSQLTAAHYQARDEDGFVEDTPPIELEYSPFNLDPTAHRWLEMDTQPGIDDQPYYLVDLFGEGVPGFLCRHDQCWYYRAPMRASTGPDDIAYSEWTPLEQVPVANHSQAVQQWLTDLTGEGRLDWISALPGMSGFRTLNPDRSWGPFTAFERFPLEFFHTLAQMGDFSGDGLDSLALIGPQAVRLYANQREAGFGPATEVGHRPADDRLPLISNAPDELVFLGNLLGSDMTELCRIRHDEIRCWPNLGHGRFGTSRRISGPVFPYEQFDAARVRIADLNGSGAPALIYLNPDGFDIYLNRGGDGLESEAVHVPWPDGVRYDRLCQVTLADLQGLGCASLILTVPHMTPRHWRYDFVSAKPYLLTASNNNMGCSAQVFYRSSAQAWLDEKREQRALNPDRHPVCHLPFPVQLVSRQLQLDEVTGNWLTQHVEYREGFYDGREREFRGFGRLQQIDSESACGDDDCSFTAPVRVCTWFHTGLSMNRSRAGYFNADTDAVDLRDTLFSRFHPADECDEPLTPPDAVTESAIARALAGSIARRETWAAADDPATACPYAVEEYRYRVREVRPRGHYAHSVLLALLLEKISYAYERLVDDPMCAHDVILCVDRYGLPTHTLTLNYPRRRQVTDTPPYSDPDEQQWWRDAHDGAQRLWYVRETFSCPIHLDQNPQQWRLGLPWRQRGNALVLPWESLIPVQVCHEHLLMHWNTPAWNALRVLTLQSVQRYLDSSDQSVLPDGEASFEALAGPLEVAQMGEDALQAYGVLPPPFDIREELKKIGYAPMPFLFKTPDEDDALQNLWSSQYSFVRYADLAGFHKVLEYRETPSHGVTRAQYDRYYLTLTRIELPDRCTTSIESSYHALQPLRIIDANDNVQEAIYEPSGQPLATSFFGTEDGQAVGFKALSEYVRPEDLRPDPAIDNPALAVQKAASTLRKDLFSWMGQLPLELRDSSALFNQWVDAGLLLPSGHIRASARRHLTQNSTPDAVQQKLIEAIAAVTRVPVHNVVLSADNYPGAPIAAQIQIVKTCIDGFGRTLQTQQLVEPGDAYVVDENGALVIEDGELLVRHAERRWRISERVEYNNKGLAVRQYRPFFANSHRYVNDASLREYGYFDQLFYDVLGRPIKLINAKGYFSITGLHPWYSYSLDFNDTAEAQPQP